MAQAIINHLSCPSFYSVRQKIRPQHIWKLALLVKLVISSLSKSFLFFFRASVSSQEPGLSDQWHGSLLAVDASWWHRRQEGHHLQHLVSALWRQRGRQWRDSVRAMRDRTAVHSAAPRPDRDFCGNTRFCNAHQLHLPRRSRERCLWTSSVCTLSGECYCQYTSSRWVAVLSNFRL